jgi:hypothetical protein
MVPARPPRSCWEAMMGSLLGFLLVGLVAVVALAILLAIINRGISVTESSEGFLGHLIQKNLHRSLLTKQPILNEAIDGLLREVLLETMQKKVS